MSITDPSADVAQPEGQGDEGTQAGNPPYSDFLARVPEEVRGDIEPIFKEWNNSVEGRFREAADLRKTWEPYQELGVNNHDPAQVEWALQFMQAATQNPQAVKQWYEQEYAPNNGLIELPAAEPPAGDEYAGYVDPNQQRLDSIEQQFQQFQEWREQQEQQQIESQIADRIAHEVEQLKAQHAANLPKEVQEQFEDIIERFSMRYAQPGADPKQVVARGWQDFEALNNQLSTAALQGKVDQPAPAEAGGAAALESDGPKSLREANRIALEQMRQNRAA